jgi:hypothetical protein
MIGPSVGVGVGHYFGGGFDPSASAFFAATGITGTTEQQAVNTLVTSLKSAGLWSKMKAVYPFVTDNRNLLSYTEAFDNAVWQSNAGATVTPRTFTAPNGTLTATTLTGTTNPSSPSVSDGSKRYYNPTTINTVVAGSNTITGSVYIYATSAITMQLFLFAWGGAEFGQSYTLTPNTWNRISITKTFASQTGQTGLAIQIGNNSCYIWGAQLELGSTATTYQPIATTQQSYISNQFKYNLVNPVDSDAAFRGVFNGGWTFSNQGATPNGTNGYMDTKLLGGTDLLTNNSGIGIYSGSNITSTGGFGFGPNFHIYPRYTDNNTYYRPMNASGGTSANNGTALGMFHEYSDGTNGNAFFNGTKKGTTTVNQTIDAANLFFGGQRPALTNYDNKQLRFAFGSLFLTDTEATALYNAVQTFNTSLSRQV